MSPLTLRLLVGAAGTAGVGAFLVGLLILRRRKRMRKQDAAVQADTGTAGERPNQPGLLQTLIVSVVASVISGVLLFFITPLFAPGSSDTAQQSELAEATVSDSTIAETEPPPDSDPESEESAPEALEETADPSSIGTTPLAPSDTEDDSETTSLVEVRTPEAAVVLADTTAEWDALLQPPMAFDEGAHGAGRLRISGASTSKISQLSPPDSHDLLEISDPRVVLGQASTSRTLYPVIPQSAEMRIDPRPIIDGASAANLLRPMPLASPHPQIRASRILVQNAVTTLLVNLSCPGIGGRQ